jgi:hypothetical protein
LGGSQNIIFISNPPNMCHYCSTYYTSVTEKSFGTISSLSSSPFVAGCTSRQISVK